MTEHIFREVCGVMVQEYSPLDRRVVSLKFQPDDGENRSLDSVYDAFGFDEMPSSAAKKALLAQDFRDLFIPRVLVRTTSSLVFHIEAGLLLVAATTELKSEQRTRLDKAALVPVALWEESGCPTGRKLDTWRRRVLNCYCK
jgi:hypothetical protein